MLALERTGDFRGLYHVLGGAISPLDGVGPDDLHIRELVARVATSLQTGVGRGPGAEASATRARRCRSARSSSP